MEANPSTMISTTPTLTPDSTLGEIVAARPAMARVFERLQLDYCCGGRQTLAQACARTGLDPQTLLAALAAAGEAAAPEVDAAGMTLTELADHIEQTHHVYVKSELPRLVEMAERVARKHAWRDARLTEVWQTVGALADEMLSHMQKEEGICFPLSVRSTRARATAFTAARSRTRSGRWRPSTSRPARPPRACAS